MLLRSVCANRHLVTGSYRRRIAAVFGAFWIEAIIGGVLGWLIGIRSINNGNPSSWHLNRHRGANFAIGVQAILLILAAASCS